MITPTQTIDTAPIQNTNNVIVTEKKMGIIPASNLAWLDASPGEIPDGMLAVISIDGQSIYVCNVRAFDGIHPGQLIKQGCLITYNGNAVTERDFKVLTGSAKLVWKNRNVLYRQYTPSNSFYGVLPKGMSVDSTKYAPVIGGYEMKNPGYLHPLYICRALADDDTVHVGKVVENGCNIAVNGKEIVEHDFQVLSTATGSPMLSKQNQIRPRSRAVVFE